MKQQKLLLAVAVSFAVAVAIMTTVLGISSLAEAKKVNYHQYFLHTPEEARVLAEMILSGEHTRTPEIISANKQWISTNGGEEPLFIAKIGDVVDAVYYDSANSRVYTSSWEVYIK